MNTIRSEESPAYTSGNGFELFTVDEQQVLLEAERLIEERYLREETVLRGTHLTKRYLSVRLANERSEVFGVLWLDNRHRVIRVEDLFRGTVDGAAVYPRGVVTSALKANASACILFHNHPSGVPEPSQNDISLTRRLKEALGLVDVRVLDHIVVGGNESVSIAERELL